jgi:hypothetical protein
MRHACEPLAGFTTAARQSRLIPDCSTSPATHAHRLVSYGWNHELALMRTFTASICTVELQYQYIHEVNSETHRGLLYLVYAPWTRQVCPGIYVACKMRMCGCVPDANLSVTFVRQASTHQSPLVGSQYNFSGYATSRFGVSYGCRTEQRVCLTHTDGFSKIPC